MLHVSNTTLRSLNVSGPSLFTLQEEHTTHFGLMLRMNTGLKRIHLGRHQMYDSGVGVMTTPETHHILTVLKTIPSWVLSLSSAARQLAVLVGTP